MKPQYVILVPGLGDNKYRVDFVTKHWKKYGVIPIVHEVPWKNSNESFVSKLQRLLERIDILSKDGEVSLVGISAGGSFVVNAYSQRKGKIKHVVNICGRLRKGGFPSLIFAVVGFPAFKESVVVCEKNIERLTKEDVKKIMTLSPIFDGVVPLTAIPITGAINIKIPFLYHSIAISGALIFYKRKIIDFILK